MAWRHKPPSERGEPSSSATAGGPRLACPLVPAGRGPSAPFHPSAAVAARRRRLPSDAEYTNPDTSPPRSRQRPGLRRTPPRLGDRRRGTRPGPAVARTTKMFIRPMCDLNCLQKITSLRYLSCRLHHYFYYLLSLRLAAHRAASQYRVLAPAHPWRLASRPWRSG